YLSDRLASRGGDVVQHAAVHDGVGAPVRAVRAERRVGGDDDAALATHLPHLLLPPPDVHLHLVHRRRHGGEREQPRHLGGGEVADADGPREAQPVALLHAAPHALHVERHQAAAQVVPRQLAGGVLLADGDGPVDEEEVDVVEAEPGQRLPERGDHARRVRVGHGELGGDEQLAAGRHGAAAHGLGDGGADRALGAVHRRGVEVAVAEAHGVRDGRRQVGRRGRRAGAEAQHRHRVARVERDARHGGRRRRR
ncbi:Os04g0167851, partial [Oryza sativa Japonica Group]